MRTAVANHELLTASEAREQGVSFSEECPICLEPNDDSSVVSTSAGREGGCFSGSAHAHHRECLREQIAAEMRDQRHELGDRLLRLPSCAYQLVAFGATR